MTEDQLNKIKQLLSSRNSLKLGFKFAESLGYSEHEIIELLLDSVESITDSISSLKLGKYILWRTNDETVEYRWTTHDMDYVTFWYKNKEVLIKYFISALKGNYESRL